MVLASHHGTLHTALVSRHDALHTAISCATRHTPARSKAPPFSCGEAAVCVGRFDPGEENLIVKLGARLRRLCGVVVTDGDLFERHK